MHKKRNKKSLGQFLERNFQEKIGFILFTIYRPFIDGKVQQFTDYRR